MEEKKKLNELMVRTVEGEERKKPGRAGVSRHVCLIEKSDFNHCQ